MGMLNPRLMLPTLATATPMLTPVFLSDPALVLTQSPRDLTLPPRDMFHTTDTVIMPTDTTTERGLLMLRLRPRLTLLCSTAPTATPTDPPTVLATAMLATLVSAMLVTMELASPPPTLLWAMLWLTLPEVSLTLPMSGSAPTIWESRSLARLPGARCPARLPTLSFVLL